MKDVTVVTGPMRSGTSCVTGLLERCGFDLGRNVRILRNQTEHNPKGHFELDLLFTINERLLSEVPNGEWGIFRVPEERSLAELAAKRERYFRLFIRKFDGKLYKDPLMCLTLPFWEKHWSELRRAVFCLRHPLAVARSMEKRYGLSVEHGLELWQTYVTRFFHSAKRSRVFVFDFDAFLRTPFVVFVPLLDWLGRPMKAEDIRECLDDFFDSKHIHWSFDDAVLRDLPTDVRDQYLEVRSYVGSLGKTCN